MKDFKEKWNTEPKFKTKVQLGLYTVFIILVSIFAFSTRSTNVTNTTEYKNDDNIKENNSETNIIDIPEKYNYIKNIIINNKEYRYKGNKDNNQESITKILNEQTIEYSYQNKEYYRKEQEIYILTTREEVYDIVNYNYLDLNTINKYLSKSILVDEEYLVYLKDIILNHNGDDCIIIKIDEDKISIDYTNLMKQYDNTIEKYLVEIIIEEIE